MKLTTQKTNNSNRTRIFDADNHIVTIEHYAKTQYEQSINEDYIVKAVNSHEELKTVIKNMIYIFDRELPENSIGEKYINKAKEALKSCE